MKNNFLSLCHLFLSLLYVQLLKLYACIPATLLSVIGIFLSKPRTLLDLMIKLGLRWKEISAGRRVRFQVVLPKLTTLPFVQLKRYLIRDTKMWFSSKLPWLWKMVIWWIILIFKIFNFQRYLFFFQSYFPSFLQSEMYYKYLSELVSTVTIATDLPKQSKHKRQGLNF